MYKSILVAVDGSETSNRALREAVALARDQGAALRIVHVIDEAVIYGASQIADAGEAEKTWIKLGNEVLGEAGTLARSAGVAAETRLLETSVSGQDIAAVIVAEARDWPADLLVTGTHGRTGLSHLLMGSVAEGIVRICSIPILLIRSK